jgi:DNA mismatch endonuclease (patch repair protein)
MKAPPASSENAHNTMRANRRVSGLEMRLRRALWAAGARGYRVQPHLPGRPDVVFPVERIAVMVHGCFWHACPTCELPKPKANADYWAAKLSRNTERDLEVEHQLHSTGWEFVVVWEHELIADSANVVQQLIRVRADRRLQQRGGVRA